MRKIPCNRLNYGLKRNTGKIIALVFHYTGNNTDTAIGNANYFKQKRAASAHFFADEVEIVESVAPEFTAWAVGGKKYADCQKTGGGTYHKIIKNNNSISIEMCSTGGKISERTQENAIALARDLIKKYPSIKYIVRHFDVTGKHCPAWSGWMIDDSIWQAFKNRILEPVYDYSLVFNAEFYLNRYPDLAKNGITKDTALQHFIMHGMCEGRQGISTFDVQAYKNRYKDLQDAFGGNMQAYYKHYIECGYEEGRNGKTE